MDVKLYLVTVIIFLVSAVGVRGIDAEENFVFGDCKRGKESCRDCYLTLVKSVFKDGNNVFDLMNVFLPPNNNPPDSVIVTYQFYNGTMDIIDEEYGSGQPLLATFFIHWPTFNTCHSCLENLSLSTKKK